MKKNLLILTLCILFGCNSTQKISSRYGQELYQSWVHSHEEDTEKGMVFRPSGTQLPYSRNRDGFEFRKDGTFIHTTVGKLDEQETVQGTWKVTDDTFVVSFENESHTPLTFKVVECIKDQLIVEMKY